MLEQEFNQVLRLMAIISAIFFIIAFLARIVYNKNYSKTSPSFKLIKLVQLLSLVILVSVAILFKVGVERLTPVLDFLNLSSESFIFVNILFYGPYFLVCGILFFRKRFTGGLLIISTILTIIFSLGVQNYVSQGYVNMPSREGLAVLLIVVVPLIWTIIWGLEKIYRNKKENKKNNVMKNSKLISVALLAILMSSCVITRDKLITKKSAGLHGVYIGVVQEEFGSIFDPCFEDLGLEDLEYEDELLIGTRCQPTYGLKLYFPNLFTTLSISVYPENTETTKFKALEKVVEVGILFKVNAEAIDKIMPYTVGYIGYHQLSLVSNGTVPGKHYSIPVGKYKIIVEKIK